ncbi:MAG: Sulfide dehydrogenase subunit alpha [Candidatus Woesearchaeota archaeon]|nr:Sulfide dehydrogenase subunit alpha [Candidatus Woesearchaeota archaeon]
MYDTIIIGAGMAGMTAAIYASRKRMKYEILAKEFGGQFMISGEILNYPGIVETTGTELSKTMQKQMQVNNIKVKEEYVKQIKKQDNHFIVIGENQQYETKTVIIATGSRPRKLNVPGEKEFTNKGVTYCSICDGPLFSGMDVAVIGGGDSAMEAVDFLKDIASKIYLIVKADKLKGHEYLIENIKSNDKVKIIYNAQTTEIIGSKLVNGLKYKKQGKEKSINVQGVIIEIGRNPSTDFVKGFLKLDKHGHIQIDCQTQTSVPGIYAAGDCASGHEYQYVISAGQGAMALIKAARYLASLKK